MTWQVWRSGPSRRRATVTTGAPQTATSRLPQAKASRGWPRRRAAGRRRPCRRSLARAPERPGRSPPSPASRSTALYTPADLPDFDYERDLGFPGEYPFTRGVHPTMYRGRFWTMRMFAGLRLAPRRPTRASTTCWSTARPASPSPSTSPRSTACDTDDPLALRRVRQVRRGRVQSLADMEILFDGIPLDQVTTSMTINGPAAVVWAFYIAAAEKRGIPRG